MPMVMYPRYLGLKMGPFEESGKVESSTVPVPTTMPVGLASVGLCTDITRVSSKGSTASER